jgi:DNA topoisomerase IA
LAKGKGEWIVEELEVVQVEEKPVNVNPLDEYTTRELLNEIMKREGWSNKTVYSEFKKIFRK